MKTDYLPVNIPVPLLKEIDKILEKKVAGYRSRTEFCVDAVRRWIWTLKQNKTLLGGDDGGGSD